MMSWDDVLQECLGRLPEARAAVCVNLAGACVIGSASRAEAADNDALQQLGAAAADLFRAGSLAEDPAEPAGAATEAIVAGTDHSLVFLRSQKQIDIAVAYRLDGTADLGLALATFRQTMAHIEAAL